MAFSEYPKALYGQKGWDDLSDYKQVKNPDEEFAARKLGYKTLSEPPGVPIEEPELPAPTICAVSLDVKVDPPKIPLKRR